MTTPCAGVERVVLASSNAGKLREFGELLGGLNIQLIAQSDLGIVDADETGLTFVENALIKARHASRLSGLPALADDSGLCVDALGGAPGLHSARYAGPGADNPANIAKLLGALTGIPDALRGAHFVCVLALVLHPDDPTPLIATGRLQGRIAQTPAGSGGFGYDPVFTLPELGRTVAELDPADKHGRSHRGKALRRLGVLLTAARQD
jgi:XTP/dITP diphosphohydrolase